MVFCFQADNGELLLLYPQDSNIFLQIASPRGFHRQALLADDYQGSLCAVIHQENLVYSYLDKEGTLIVRAANQKLPLLEKKAAVNASSFAPKLIAKKGELLLFYLKEEENATTLTLTVRKENGTEQDYGLSSVREESILLFPNDIPGTEKTELFFLVCSSAGDLETASPASGIPSEAPQEIQLYRLTDEYSLKECTPPPVSCPEQLLEENEILSYQLRQASEQYKELMDVATQYRDEARKWYQKYIKR